MKKPITVRIEERLLSEARERAREENRTLTNFIETLLRQGVLKTTRNRAGTADENQANG